MTRPPLVLRRPPGRSTRKASAYSAEIRQLQADGYSLDAIRDALAEAGVVVSKSTVHREARRKSSGRPPPSFLSPTSATVLTTTPASTACSSADAGPPVAAPPQPQSGREVAAAFFSQHIANPLLQKDPP